MAYRLGGRIESGAWTDLSVEGARTAQAGGAEPQVALNGHLGWEPPPPSSPLHPGATLRSPDALPRIPSGAGSRPHPSPFRSFDSGEWGERFFAPTHNRILISGVCSPLRRGDACVAPSNVRFTSIPGNGSLPSRRPFSVVRPFALAPRSRAAGSGSGGGAAQRRGRRGDGRSARGGAPDPGAVRNAACPALVARRVVNGRQGWKLPPRPCATAQQSRS